MKHGTITETLGCAPITSSVPWRGPVAAAGVRDAIRVIALIAAYNEADVIAQVIGDLVGEGVEVYLLDHGSTDGTVAAAQPWLGNGLLAIERFPEDSGFPPEDARVFAWGDLLRRKEELARTLGATWFMHHDADELRESPWDGVSLRDALARVDDLGYSAVEFKVLDFVPTDDGFQSGGDLRRSFTHYRPAAAYDRVQIKAWKQPAGGVDLASSGGHEARFSPRRVFPVRFLCRHYPIRSQAHGERKVLRERRPRFLGSERDRGWHVQYDLVDAATRFVATPDGLIAYDAGRVRAELAVENRELVDAEVAVSRLEIEAGDVAWFRAEWPARERELVRTAAALEAATAKLAQIEAARADGAAHAASLQVRLDEILASLSWRSTAPLRNLLRQLRGY